MASGTDSIYETGEEEEDLKDPRDWVPLAINYWSYYIGLFFFGWSIVGVSDLR